MPFENTFDDDVWDLLVVEITGSKYVRFDDDDADAIASIEWGCDELEYFVI